MKVLMIILSFVFGLLLVALMIVRYQNEIEKYDEQEKKEKEKDGSNKK